MVVSYSSRWGVSALVFVVGMMALTPEASASYALEEWNMEARRSLPLTMKLWLAAMLITNLAAVFFVRKHVAARWVLGAWLFSHAWIAILEGTGAYAVQGGLVSLGHIIVWAPALYALYRYRSEMKLPSVYGVWASLMLFFYGVSLIFDVRDAFIWLSANLF